MALQGQEVQGVAVTSHKYVQPESQRFVVLSLVVQPAKDIQGFVALCPVLGVASQGATFEEAENNIREAVGLYLTTIDDDGELERIFAEKGLTIGYADSGGAAQSLLHRGRTAEGGQTLAELFPIGTAA